MGMNKQARILPLSTGLKYSAHSLPSSECTLAQQYPILEDIYFRGDLVHYLIAEESTLW